MVDTPALGAGAARHGSSSLPSPTKTKVPRVFLRDFCFYHKQFLAVDRTADQVHDPESGEHDKYTHEAPQDVLLALLIFARVIILCHELKYTPQEHNQCHRKHEPNQGVQYVVFYFLQ